MSATSETTLTAMQGAIFGDLTRNWGWLMALGIICIILGTIGFYMTFALTLASVQVFGILILAGGGLQLLDAFTCKGWKGVLWHVLIALLYLGAGAVLLYEPLLGAKFLTLVIAALLIAVGVARFIIGLQLRPADGWYWPVLSGLISSLLGGMIIAQWPLSGLWVIGLFVAIELVVNGWASGPGTAGLWPARGRDARPPLAPRAYNKALGSLRYPRVGSLTESARPITPNPS